MTTLTNAHENAPLLLSVPEAAAVLGISKRYAQLLIAGGALPTIRLGRRRLVHRADLEAFITERREQPQ
jgi:excisionase family DNA binding protein